MAKLDQFGTLKVCNVASGGGKTMSETHPGFNELRKRHQITLEALIEDTQIDPRAVLLMDTWGIGTPDHIDTLLESLSRLAGVEYSRQAMNVWDLTFKLHPNYESITDIETLLAIDNNGGKQA